MSEVNLHIDLGEYKEATDKLISINKDYPNYADYSEFMRLSDYDKIKKEYPPFQTALNNLKLKPPLNVNQFIEL